MAQEVRLRRGTANQHSTFTGAEGEVTVDTTNDTIRVHDGSLAGGHRLAKYSELVDAAAITYNTTLTGNTTITTLILSNVLGTEYGGTGLTSFTENGVMFGANTSSLSFTTGTDGQVLQISANGTPSFDVLDGGTFS
jgi:hypothetical protein